MRPTVATGMHRTLILKELEADLHDCGGAAAAPPNTSQNLHVESEHGMHRGTWLR